MKLIELNAELLKLSDHGFRVDATMAEAQGVIFDCPVCSQMADPTGYRDDLITSAMLTGMSREASETHAGRVLSVARKGVHKVICWFRCRGVPDTMSPGPGRWDASGTGIADLTLSPSVHLSGPGCGWHGWVRNGDAT